MIKMPLKMQPVLLFLHRVEVPLIAKANELTTEREISGPTGSSRNRGCEPGSKVRDVLIKTDADIK
jgi:hypothetical protein